MRVSLPTHLPLCLGIYKPSGGWDASRGWIGCLGCWSLACCALHRFTASMPLCYPCTWIGFTRPAWVATDYHYHGLAWLHGHIAIKEDTHPALGYVSVYLCMNVSSVRGICNPYYVVFCPHLPISAYICLIGTLIACHKINDMR